ncbi:hypothetical protein [Streptomyces maremycinicus]|uniref:hypothetical protein n=1 Tax=Streptomyces maremycinicus TaxID=1679753 RepID=UPI000AD3468A|nr:hypothetical protein [Streptomyces sp. NBRC 110468]
MGGAAAAALAAVLLLAIRAAARVRLDRRRMAQWEAEWGEIEPRWSRRRHA